jgi:hypothetical protein
LAKVCNCQTAVVDYDWQKTTLIGLAQKISNALIDNKLKSIAFAAHGNYTGKFELTQKDIVSIESLQNDKNQAVFWKTIGHLLEKQGRVDLFGCKIGLSRNKNVLLEHLEKLIERPIAFADHKIGSSDLGGDWILNEVFKQGKVVKQEINLSQIYFKSKLLHEWSGVFPLAVDVGVTDRSINNVLTDEPLLLNFPAPQDIYSTTTVTTGNADSPNFGSSISVGATKMVAVGKGIIEFFDYAGSRWARTSSFTTADKANPLLACMWETQNLAIIGYPAASSNQGSMSCYQYANATWSAIALPFNLPSLVSGDLFGCAIAANSNFLVVGASGASSLAGAVYVYTAGSANPATLIAGLPAELSFGQAVAIENTRLVVGSAATNGQGCVYIFDYNGTTWLQTQRIVPSDAANNQYFGCSVALSGDRIVVGAYGDTSNAGAIYVFEKGLSSSTWTQQSKLVPADVASEDKFGLAVALLGNVIVASSPLKVVNDSSFASVSGAGQVYFLERKTNGWAFVSSMTKPSLLSANDAGISINTGSSVALNQQYVFIGIPGDKTQATNAGKLLTYQVKDSSIALEHYNNMNVDHDQTASVVDGTGGATLLGGAYDVKVSGKYTYLIATTDQGLTIFDTSDPFSPTFISQVALGITPSAFDIYGNYIYVSSSAGNCIKIINVTTPASPGITSVSLPGVGMIKVANGQLYAHVNTSLQRYDLISSATLGSAPSTYTNASYLVGSTTPNGMYIEGNYLYVTNTTNKITILNIANTPPTFVTEITGVTTTPQALAVKNNYLYVLGNTGNSIQIYNVNNAASPVLVKTLTQTTDGNYLSGLTSISIEKWHVYVSSTSSKAVTIVDIFDPPNAFVAKELVYNTNRITGLNGVQGIVVNNGYLYTADGVGNAFTILKTHTPTRGMLNRVLRFNGSNQFVKLPSFSLPSQAITLETRFYLTSTPSSNAALFDLANGTASDNIILFLPNSTPLKIKLQLYQGSTNKGSLTSITTIALYTWYHVSVTINSLGECAIYINGQLDISGPIAVPNSLARTSNYIAADNWSFPPGGDQFFGGMIREARIWSTSLTQKQILNNLRSTLSGNETNLLAYYPFNEESGAVAYDLSQQKRNATLGASVSSLDDKPTRIFGNDPFTSKYSLVFNGSTSVVTIPHDIILNAYPLTISVWMRTTLNTATQVGIVNKYATSSNVGYQLYMINGTICAWYWYNSSRYVFASSNAFTGGFIADGQWHYVSFTVAANGGKLYIDGGERGSVGWTGTPGKTTTSQDLSIGLYGSNYFVGDIAEVSIWDTSLSQPDIKKYMQSRPLGSESNLIAYYNFAEGTGTTLTDLSSNSFNGTIANSTWRRAVNPSQTLTSQALYFNGSSAYATIPHSPAFNAIPMSVGFWFNFNKGYVTSNRGIIDKISTSPSNGYHIVTGAGAGTLTLSQFTDTAGYGAIYTSAVVANNVDDGRSHYIVATLSNTTACLYADGKLVSSSTGLNLGSSTTTANLLLGRYTSGYTKCFINNLSFWDRVLTPKEVQVYAFKPIPSTSITGLLANYNFSELNGQYIYDSSGSGYHGYLGALPTSTAADPSYTMSLARNSERYYLASNKYTVLSFNTYDPDSNNYSILIKTLPNQGMLYQYNTAQPNYCGAQITSGNTALLDTSQRAVYYPNMTGASSYDVVNFNYSCYDGSYETCPSTVYINLYAPVTISGTVAGQAITDKIASIQPFTTVVVSKVDLSTKWTYTITLDNVGYGSLSGTIGTYNSTTGVYTLSNVSASVAEADIRTIVFTLQPDAIPATTTQTIRFTIACSNGSVSDSTTTVVITSINDAPVLTAANPVMTTIAATNTSNTGQTVASILGTSVTDVDFGAVEGMAITAFSIPSGSGAWQYSINGGTTWAAFGAVSLTSALLLRDTDRVRFLPDGTYQASGSFSYYAWDQTSGTAGSLANVTTRGGTTAYSLIGDTATITVTGLHAAWTLTTTAGATSYVLTNPSIIIDSGVAETDAATTVTGASIVIQITAGFHSKDIITISSQGVSAGQINIVGNYVKYGSIIIGTYSGGSTGGTALRIILNKNATQASINAVMRRISFYNNDTTATIGNRIVTYTYSDNHGTTHSATKIVSVTATAPSPPVIPISSTITAPTVTSIYNTLASANQYANSFSQISSYLRRFFFFR